MLQNLGALLEFFRNSRNKINLIKFAIETFAAPGAYSARLAEILKNPLTLFTVNRRGWKYARKGRAPKKPGMKLFKVFWVRRKKR